MWDVDEQTPVLEGAGGWHDIGIALLMLVLSVWAFLYVQKQERMKEEQMKKELQPQFTLQSTPVATDVGQLHLQEVEGENLKCIVLTLYPRYDEDWDKDGRALPTIVFDKQLISYLIERLTALKS